MPEVVQTLEDAKANFSAGVASRGAVVRPVLIDIRQGGPLSAEARHHYTGGRLSDIYSAMALLTTTGAFGTMMANLYIKVASPGIPTRLFYREDEATAWLLDS